MLLTLIFKDMKELFFFFFLNASDYGCDLCNHCSKGILESLRKRARIMTDGFNSCRNVVCNFTEGNKSLPVNIFFS